MPKQKKKTVKNIKIRQYLTNSYTNISKQSKDSLSNENFYDCLATPPLAITHLLRQPHSRLCDRSLLIILSVLWERHIHSLASSMSAICDSGRAALASGSEAKECDSEWAKGDIALARVSSLSKIGGYV